MNLTTWYPFHRWIEPTSTANTVTLSFGGWWDADSIPNSAKGLINGGLINAGLVNGGLIR